MTSSMGASYSKDFRKRVLDYVEERHTRQQAADLFKISLNSVYRWQRLRRAKQSLAAKVREPKARKLDYEKLKAYVKATPEATLKEYAQTFRVSHVSIFAAFKKLGITRKKSRSSTGKGTRRRGGYLLRRELK